MSARVLFFGTPAIAVPFLERLIERFTVAGVVTQPDRPAARGYQLHMPPVKELALKRGLPVFQPERFDPETAGVLAALRPDIGVVVAYGRLIPETVFTLPQHRCFNIHFSLLPRYRGAAPVQWAIINGERETGVTAFQLEKGLDTGPVIVQERLAIDPLDDAPSLMAKLVPLGVSAMERAVEACLSGSAVLRPQDGETNYAPVLKKSDGAIDWTRSAAEIFNRIRGTRPWPGAWTRIAEGGGAGKHLKILKARPVAGGTGKPGRVASIIKNTGFVVQCGSGLLQVEEVHPENRRPMSAWAYLQGGELAEGSLLHTEDQQ